MGEIHPRGFRRWCCQGRTSGQNAEANFTFITFLPRATPVLVHTLIHAPSFNLVATKFQAVVGIKDAKMNTIYFLALGALF